MNWKGGRHLDSQGYFLVWMPDHPRSGSNGYVREHILVWETANGPVPHGMVVHHKNGNKQNNRLENLELLASQAEHVRLHKALRPPNGRSAVA